MPYIRIPAVWDKLREAEENFRPVLMLANAGYGKTSAVNYYYRKRSVRRLSGLSGALDAMPAPEGIRQGVIIVDNVSWITDHASEQYLIRLLAAGTHHVVLIGRGHIPPWLAQLSVGIEFEYITARELAMDEGAVKKLFHGAKVPLTEEETALILRTMEGYPPAVLMVLAHAKRGDAISRATFSEIRVELFHYHETAFWQLWKEEVRELLLAVCRYPVFTPHLAARLSGLPDVNGLLDYCRRIGQFMDRVGPEKYALLDEMRAFLCWKQDMLWSMEQIRENYRTAAEYYLAEDRVSEALTYYEKAGDTGRIRQALITNAVRHPGIGAYYELRHYYLSLSREDLAGNSLLLSGICMLHSLLMKPEESNRAYEALTALQDREDLPEARREEARDRAAVLDVSLPHRAAADLPGALERLRKIHAKTGGKIPAFSLTDNCPSVLNGAFDLCALEEPLLTRDVLTPLETLPGHFGRGITETALGEIGFERNSMSSPEITAHLNRGYAEADSAGNTELIFAAQGILIRQQVAAGNLAYAKESLERLRQKSEIMKAGFLAGSLRALGAWLSLYTLSGEEVQAFVADSPDPRMNFYIMNRFCYRVRLRCLMMLGRYPEALDLSAFLSHYYTEYNRIYLSIENDFLRAIILHRTGQAEWRRLAEHALEQAEKYRLVQAIAMEGAAALPLLSEMKNPRKASAFRNTVLKAARAMALAYPGYLQMTAPRRIRFTPREQEILSMLCAGESTETICARMSIGYSALKKHNRSIYGKLGAKNRAEAEREAARLGIVKR